MLFKIREQLLVSEGSIQIPSCGVISRTLWLSAAQDLLDLP